MGRIVSDLLETRAAASGSGITAGCDGCVTRWAGSRRCAVAMDKVFDEEAKKNPFFAKVLASQREFAQRVVPHAARMRPPLETAVSHYWAK